MTASSGILALMDSDYLSGAESWLWLRARMLEVNINTLDDLSVATSINKGTISKYFHQKQRPSIDSIPVLCEVLKVSPETLLVALGAMKRPKDFRKSQ